MNTAPKQIPAAPVSPSSSPKKNRKTLLALLLGLILAAVVCYDVFFFLRQQQSARQLAEALAVAHRTLQANSEVIARLQVRNTSPPAIPLPDPRIAEQYAELSALDSLLDSLAPVTGIVPQTPAETAQEVTQPATRWQRIQHALQRVWGQLVVIRHDGEERQWLTPGIHQIILLQLHGELQAARWALLHHDAAVWETALDNARKLLKQHFSVESTRDILEKLDKASFPDETGTSP